MSLSNPTYNQLAQIAHVAAFYGIALTLMIFHPTWRWEVQGIGIAYGLLKEFWFDLRYETTEISGEFVGGLTDFSFLMIGLGLADITFYFVKGYLHAN